MLIIPAKLLISAEKTKNKTTLKSLRSLTTLKTLKKSVRQILPDALEDYSLILKIATLIGCIVKVCLSAEVLHLASFASLP